MSDVAPAILPLAVEDVSWRAGASVIVRDLSFALRPGGVSVVLGPNGAGKSVTLRLCHGLLQPSSGRIRWQGPQAADAARHQAMVFQRPAMLRRSVAANIDYALRVRGLPAAVRGERIAGVLRDTGLAPLAGRAARSLSGGEQQRLALARVWALEPEVLFLDEPAAFLDPAAARRVEEIIAAVRDAGTKIVLTTHDLAQARRFADEVLFLHGGVLLEHAPAAAFFERPESEAGRAFLAGTLSW